jgi:hypothetical protein
MLKKITLTGLFLLASALSFQTVASTQSGRPATTDSAPKAPVGHGLCPSPRC